MEFVVSYRRTDANGEKSRITYPDRIQDTNGDDAISDVMRRICQQDPLAFWDYDTIETSDGATLDSFKAERAYYWWIVDVLKNGDLYTEKTTAATQEDADRLASYEWNHLSAYDQNRRESFYAVLLPADEDDETIPDGNTTERGHIILK